MRWITRLNERLHAHEVFIHLTLWISSQQRSCRVAHSATRWVVREFYFEPSRAVFVPVEADDPGVRHACSFNALPREELVWHCRSYNCIPFDRRAGRSFNLPVRTSISYWTHLLHISH